MAMNVRVTKIDTEATLRMATQKMSVWFIVVSDTTKMEVMFEVMTSSFDDGVNQVKAKLNQFAADLAAATAPQRST